MLQTVESYDHMKQKTKQYQKNAEEALVYFDEEIVERMRNMVLLIADIQKNANPVKLKNLKRSIMLQNL